MTPLLQSMAVRRWHTQPAVAPQTNGEHIANGCLLLARLYPEALHASR